MHNRLKELRTKRGLTQEEFSKRMGLLRSTYSNYESGKREPDYETLSKIAEEYDVSVDYIMGRTPDPRQTLSQDTRSFLEAVDLSDEEALNKLKEMLIHNGQPLSEETLKEIIAYARYRAQTDRQQS